MFDYKLLIKEYEKKGYAEFKSLYEKKRNNINLLPLEIRTKFNLLLARLALINNDNATYNDVKNLLDYENNTCTCKEILQNLEKTYREKYKDTATGEMEFVKLPDTNVEMLSTLVTQKLFKEVMETNPSFFNEQNYPPDEGEVPELRPVENVSFYDAIYFCNKLSSMHGLDPVYSVNGKTDVTCWEYTLCEGLSIKATVNIDYEKNGYRVPKTEEWEKAVKKVYNIANSYNDVEQDKFEKYDWNIYNSRSKTHAVKSKNNKLCDFYDILGNVKEMTGNTTAIKNSEYSGLYEYGGAFDTTISASQLSNYNRLLPSTRKRNLGFRIVRRIK